MEQIYVGKKLGKNNSVKQNTLSLFKGRVFVLNLAETRRFELLKGLTPYLVSSEAHSTGLCDVSKCEARIQQF
jgi:hypothetical protein